MLETAHAAMRPWPLFSHESFGHVLMLDSYMHACDRSMGAIELHDPTGCFMSVGKARRSPRILGTGRASVERGRMHRVKDRVALGPDRPPSKVEFFLGNPFQWT